ncbi:MAG: hypothetical protein H6711_04450 [Myxococcales bacterium]|nr:hypothetical protein [Myxococcales bacterium]
MSNEPQPLSQQEQEDYALVLAAEEFEIEAFARVHKFSDSDEVIIRKLSAHGPVLLQGGRGTGKSALMRETGRRLSPAAASKNAAIAIYISLRHLPLLRAAGSEYQRLFSVWVSEEIQRRLQDSDLDFDTVQDISSLKRELANLGQATGKRIVLLFDDAAHIGRETSLETFFDIFRTLPSDSISCKAAIYPGVTEFGARFDVYNDATVLDIVKNSEQSDFEEHFAAVLSARYPRLAELAESGRPSSLSLGKVSRFLGRAVLGNHRAFIFACNALSAFSDDSIGLTALQRTLVRLAASHYWPLLEEVKPKLGKYTPAADTATEVAEEMFKFCALSESSSVIIHRAVVARYSKVFEILEYAGFIARREASRAMKSGGRGPRYDLNLCNLLECVSGSRLTRRLFGVWSGDGSAVAQIHRGGDHFSTIAVPVPEERADLHVFEMPIDSLRKSDVYPYGLTDRKIEELQKSGFATIGDVAEASDHELLSVDTVGEVFLDRIRSIVAQAVWM